MVPRGSARTPIRPPAIKRPDRRYSRLWRWVTAPPSSASPISPTESGCSTRQRRWAGMGTHQLPRAIRHPRLDLLRLWSRPVRPPRRYQRADHRSRRLLRTGAIQRVVAGPLPLRSGRMAVAYADVRRGAADEIIIDAKANERMIRQSAGRSDPNTFRSCTRRATGRGWCLPAPGCRRARAGHRRPTHRRPAPRSRHRGRSRNIARRC